MAHVDSLATGWRDTDEIEVTPAMIAAGRSHLEGHNPNRADHETALRALFLAMWRVRSASRHNVEGH